MARNVPTPPANQNTPNFNVVDTVAGFNQGDMVYFNNGDYGRLANTAVTTANFNVTNPVPALLTNSSVRGGATTILAASTFTGTFGGTVSSQSAARLSNGNIVRVGGDTSNYPYFVITDTSNNVVVAPTIISTTYSMNNNGGVVSVAALVGGGFAVAYTNNLTSTIYAVYTNTGSVTLSVVSDTTLLPVQGPCPASVLALPNGGFVVAQIGNSVVLFRIFNAAGTALYTTTTWSLPAAPNYSTGQVQMAARSDSSFLLHVPSNGQTTAYYAVYSATNTQLTTGNTFPTNAAACVNGVSASVLADGTTFVLGYQNYQNAGLAYYSAFKFLPTGNVLGNEISMFPVPGGNNTIGYNVFSLGLASGNFIFGQVDGSAYITYAFYSPSGVAISGTLYGQTLARTAAATGFSSSNARSNVCPLEYSSNVNLFWSEGSGYSTSQSAACLVSLSQITYDPIPLALSANLTVGTTSQPVNGVVQSTQNPISASFYAANTATVFQSSVAGGALLVSPTVITSNNSDSLAVITLTGGNFVIAYRSPFTGVVSAAVYSPAGALQTTIIVGTGLNSCATDSVRAAALTSGKFVISYANGTGSNQSVTSVVYSPAYAVLATINTTGLTLQYGSTIGSWTQSVNVFDISGITNDRFVLTAISTSTSYPTYFVYSSSGGAALSTATIRNSVTQLCAITGLPQGGFAAFSYINGSGWAASAFTNTTGNTFTQQYNTTTGNTGYIYSPSVASFPNGSYAVYYVNSPSVLQVSFFSSGSSSNAQQITIGNQNNTGLSAQSIGSTAYGEPVFVFGTAANAVSYSVTTLGANSSSYRFDSVLLSGVSTYTQGPLKTSNLYGRYMVLAYLNASQYPSFVVFNTTPFLGTLQTTAGVTQSNAATISTPMAGIAASTASANTSGVLQTNGNCQVNSNYPSTTPYTTFSNGGTAGGYGVKGSILGRNVQLLNNF